MRAPVVAIQLFSQSGPFPFCKKLSKYVCFVLNITLFRLTVDRNGLVHVVDQVLRLICYIECFVLMKALRRWIDLKIHLRKED